MRREMSTERNWTDTETKALLSIRAHEDINQQISGTVKDSLIYEEISRLLMVQGIQRTKGQVTSKLKSLKQKFLKMNDHHKKNGNCKIYWNYYELCQSIWGTRRSANTLPPRAVVKLEEPQSTSLEDAREENLPNDIEVTIDHREETDRSAEVTPEPPKKKTKKDCATDSVREQEAVHLQDQREYEDRLRREAREEQKEERANLMAMWKEMMEFQGNLLKEFMHRPTPLPPHQPYQQHDHLSQGSSSFPSTNTGHMEPFDSPEAETENESSTYQWEEGEEEKYSVPTVNGANDSQSNIAVTLSPPPTPSTEKRDLEMSVLHRQERVLQLQEEYYSLKIKYLKDKMAMSPEQNDKQVS